MSFMIKISVLTPTIRVNGLEPNRASLQAQTFPQDEFEWLVELNTTGTHDINAAYNRMLRRSKGELVVSMQDWIQAPPRYLQNFWEAYQQKKDTFFTSPLGKVTQLDFLGDISWDWRVEKKGTIAPEEWEIDSGCAPREAFFEVGGFDETLDGNWSSENVSVAKRAAQKGYKFENLASNPVRGYDHDRVFKHPFRDSRQPELISRQMEQYTGEPLHYLVHSG